MGIAVWYLILNLDRGAASVPMHDKNSCIVAAHNWKERHGYAHCINTDTGEVVE